MLLQSIVFFGNSQIFVIGLEFLVLLRPKKLKFLFVQNLLTNKLFAEKVFVDEYIQLLYLYIYTYRNIDKYTNIQIHNLFIKIMIRGISEALEQKYLLQPNQPHKFSIFAPSAPINKKQLVEIWASIGANAIYEQQYPSSSTSSTAQKSTAQTNQKQPQQEQEQEHEQEKAIKFDIGDAIDNWNKANSLKNSQQEILKCENTENMLKEIFLLTANFAHLPIVAPQEHLSRKNSKESNSQKNNHSPSYHHTPISREHSPYQSSRNYKIASSNTGRDQRNSSSSKIYQKDYQYSRRYSNTSNNSYRDDNNGHRIQRSRQKNYPHQHPHHHHYHHHHREHKDSPSRHQNQYQQQHQHQYSNSSSSRHHYNNYSQKYRGQNNNSKNSRDYRRYDCYGSNSGSNRRYREDY